MTKSIPFLLGFILFGMVLSASYAQTQPGAGTTNLPNDETNLFAGSGVCARCHEGLFENNTDVSPVTLWRSTMMANSAKDPLWRAKVAREGAEFPNLAGAIEEKCIKCHSPVLYKQSAFDVVPYSIDDLVNDPLAKDGDTCTVCHQILPHNFGSKDSFSGDFMIWDPDDPVPLRNIFGPYLDPFVGPMVNNCNYTPTFAYPYPSGYTINDAEHCATCHNLFTNYVDSNGEIPEGQTKFPEQTPYYEWKNSDYSNSTDPSKFKTCQGCHMPKSPGKIKISTVAPAMTSEREPFWYHHFVGGNYFMPPLLNDNIDLLGVTATAAHFDTTITNTKDLLQNDTLDLSADYAMAHRTLNVDVNLQNLAGHKLPTGIPLRRVWIHLKVLEGNNVIFESGAWNAATGRILGVDDNYEPHYDVINDENQVQIYEGVMVDDWGDVTRLLLRAKDFVKDNRLPPKGFDFNHNDYDYMKIMGAAESDPDFNANKNGADTVHYEIPIGASSGPFTVDIEVCYQTVTPDEVLHLTSSASNINIPEIKLFHNLYTAADKAPLILKSLVLSNVN